MTVTESRIRKIETRLDEIEETMEIPADRNLLRAIKIALDEMKHGMYSEYKDFSELMAGLESEQ